MSPLAANNLLELHKFISSAVYVRGSFTENVSFVACEMASKKFNLNWGWDSVLYG